MNQRWKILYLDEIKKGGKGGYNSDFGFHINRPFYIVSRLHMKRVIEVVGGRNLVIRTRHQSRNTQKWIFNGASKTITSVHYRDRSFDI